MRLSKLSYKNSDRLWAQFKKKPKVERLLSGALHSNHAEAPEHQLLLATESIPIAEDTFPDLYRIFRSCCSKLKMTKEIRTHVVASNDSLASAYIHKGTPHISLDSSLITAFPDTLAFIFGHELAHIKLGHCSRLISNSSLAELSEDARRLWLMITRSREISADRLALLCCSSESAAEGAIVSLSFKHLISPVSFEAIIESIPKIEHLVSNNPWLSLGDATHPHMAIRLASLREFRSKAIREGVAIVGFEKALEGVDKYVEKLLGLYLPGHQTAEHSLFIHTVFILALKYQKLREIDTTCFDKYANNTEVKSLRSLIRRKSKKSEFLETKARGYSKDLKAVADTKRLMWLMRVAEVFRDMESISPDDSDVELISKLWHLEKEMVLECFDTE